jgi:hypothetical protein
VVRTIKGLRDRADNTERVASGQIKYLIQDVRSLDKYSSIALQSLPSLAGCCEERSDIWIRIATNYQKRMP